MAIVLLLLPASGPKEGTAFTDVYDRIQEEET